MSPASTLDQARDFLLLPADTPADEVWRTAGERQAVWSAKCADPRSPARLKEGAARKLRELAPLLPLLEIEVELEGIRRTAEDSHAGKNQILRLCDNVARKIEALPKSEEKAMLACRVEDLREAVKPPTPPPPPPPPDPAEQLFAEKIAALNAALGGRDLLAAFALLAEATALMRQLREKTAQDRAAAELALAAECVQQLKAGAEADAARQTSVAENVAALRTALEQRDRAGATPLLAAAGAAAATLRDPVVRARTQSELAALAARLQELEGEAGREADRQKAVAGKLAALHAALERGESVVAGKLLDEVRPLAAAGTDPTVRDKALAEIGVCAQAWMQLLERQKADRRAQPGQVLKLVPQETGLITGVVPLPLHFVARPRFVLGRFGTGKTSRADFSCPLTEKRVSRAHVTLSRKGEDIMIQDGDGQGKSANGSKLDDETLTPAAVPASFAHERAVSLGGVFFLAAQHLPGEAPSGPTPSDASVFDTGGRTTVINLVSGCMRFTPKEDVLLPAQVVWLFSDASFGSAPSNAVPLPNSSLADKHGRVHFWQDGFWLENLRSGTAIAITEAPSVASTATSSPHAHALAKGEVVPLGTGDVVKLGQIDYIVTVES